MSTEKILVEYWQIHVCDGFSGAIHNDYTKITEIYIPELELMINTSLNPIYVRELSYNESALRYERNLNDFDRKVIHLNPRLLKTVMIDKTSDEGQSILWIADNNKIKKEKEFNILKLFD
jgi:hypothetical protein